MKKTFVAILLGIVFLNPVQASDQDNGLILGPVVTMKTLRRMVEGKKVPLEGKIYELYQLEETKKLFDEIPNLFSLSWQYIIERDDFGYKDGKFSYEIGKTRVSSYETFHVLESFRIVEVTEPVKVSLIPQTWADV